jgi:hypothetical protein
MFHRCGKFHDSRRLPLVSINAHVLFQLEKHSAIIHDHYLSQRLDKMRPEAFDNCQYQQLLSHQHIIVGFNQSIYESDGYPPFRRDGMVCFPIIGSMGSERTIFEN